MKKDNATMKALRSLSADAEARAEYTAVVHNPPCLADVSPDLMTPELARYIAEMRALADLGRMSPGTSTFKLALAAMIGGR